MKVLTNIDENEIPRIHSFEPKVWRVAKTANMFKAKNDVLMEKSRDIKTFRIMSWDIENTNVYRKTQSPTELAPGEIDITQVTVEEQLIDALEEMMHNIRPAVAAIQNVTQPQMLNLNRIFRYMGEGYGSMLCTVPNYSNVTYFSPMSTTGLIGNISNPEEYEKPSNRCATITVLDPLLSNDPDKMIAIANFTVSHLSEKHQIENVIRMLESMKVKNSIIVGGFESYRKEDYTTTAQKEWLDVILKYVSQRDFEIAQNAGYVELFDRLKKDAEWGNRVPLNTSWAGGRRHFLFFSRDFDFELYKPTGAYVYYLYGASNLPLVVDFEMKISEAELKKRKAARILAEKTKETVPVIQKMLERRMKEFDERIVSLQTSQAAKTASIAEKEKRISDIEAIQEASRTDAQKAELVTLPQQVKVLKKEIDDSKESIKKLEQEKEKFKREAKYTGVSLNLASLLSGFPLLPPTNIRQVFASGMV